MAECPENPTTSEESTAGQGINLLVGAMQGQSKSKSDSFREFDELDEETRGKEENTLYMVCRYCQCKIMRPGKGILVEREIFLPSMTEKYRIGSDPAGDTLTRFWLLTDMFHFENVGFSKTIEEKVKYLICADCERGPIGWHDLTNRTEFFLAAERVHYSTS